MRDRKHLGKSVDSGLRIARCLEAKLKNLFQRSLSIGNFVTEEREIRAFLQEFSVEAVLQCQQTKLVRAVNLWKDVPMFSKSTELTRDCDRK